MASKKNLFTIGHSTHPLEAFLGLVGQHGIEALVDIRRFPGSKKYPHFNSDTLLPPCRSRAWNTNGLKPWEVVGTSSVMNPRTWAWKTKDLEITPTTCSPRSSGKGSRNCSRSPGKNGRQSFVRKGSSGDAIAD
jgi:hypothetical protein